MNSNKIIHELKGKEKSNDKQFKSFVGFLCFMFFEIYKKDKT